MPGRDASGPMGQGPMTGRGAGFCADYDAPGYANFGLGRARGRGLGRGRGFRHVFRATGLPSWARTQPNAGPAPAPDADQLRARANWLMGQLERINRRLTELEQQE